MKDRLDDVLSFLNNLPKVDVKPGLYRVERLLDSLGNPQQSYRSIHIGGSNGKGSVLAILSGGIRDSYRVGEFVSPPLTDFSDRIKVDGLNIDKKSIITGVNKLREPIKKLRDEGNEPTLFEVATALASWYFDDKGVEIALMEVGLGGRYDATKPIGKQLMSIVTSVDLEHQEILGDTLEDIAGEIAGIATPNSPLVLGPVEDFPMTIFMDECDAVSCRIKRSSKLTQVNLRDFNWKHSRFAVEKSKISELESETVELGLLGTFQEFNLTTALTALGELKERELTFSSKNLLTNLRNLDWPGRFQLVRENPHLVLDGAHNLAAVELLTKEIARYGLLLPENSRTTVVFSSLADKPAKEMLAQLSGSVDNFIITRLESPRGAKLPRLREMAEDLSLNYELEKSPQEAFDRALNKARSSDLIVFSGSLYLVREAFTHGFASKN